MNWHTWQRIFAWIETGLAYFLIGVCGIVWLIMMLLVYAIRGASEKVWTSIPTEWRAIVRSWQKVGFGIMVAFIVSFGAAAQDRPIIEANAPGHRVEVNMDDGTLTLYAEDRIINLGTLTKSGDLRIASNVIGNDFAVALVIMVRSGIGDDAWSKMVERLGD